MIRAYHFVGDTLRDGRPVPKDGELLKFDGEPLMCQQGLHASRHPFDALKYAPGQTLCLVKLGGTIVEGDDKLVATERTIVRRIDATELLRFFARMQAVSVLHLWKSEPPDVVLNWLMTGDESIRDAAWSAARSAARSAAWSAAQSAAWSAAWSASESSARSASESSAWLASESAAWSASESAAWSASESASESAAWSAAWSAARSAAWSASESAARSAAWLASESAARDFFDELVKESLG